MKIKNIDVITVLLNFLFVLYTLLHRRLYLFWEDIFLSYTNLPQADFWSCCSRAESEQKKKQNPRRSESRKSTGLAPIFFFFAVRPDDDAAAAFRSSKKNRERGKIVWWAVSYHWSHAGRTNANHRARFESLVEISTSANHRGLKGHVVWWAWASRIRWPIMIKTVPSSDELGKHTIKSNTVSQCLLRLLRHCIPYILLKYICISHWWNTTESQFVERPWFQVLVCPVRLFFTPMMSLVSQRYPLIRTSCGACGLWATRKRRPRHLRAWVAFSCTLTPHEPSYITGIRRHVKY